MSDTNVYSQILREDIPESYRDLLDTLGRETFFKVVRACSGQNLYIPKWESLERNAPGPGHPGALQRRQLPSPGRSVPPIRAADPKIINGTRT